MSWKIYLLLVLVIFQTIYAKDPELPLCPTNIAFFPQNLPMHCRMANGNTFNSAPIPMKSQQSATYPPSIYQSPSPNKVPPMPFPVPPGYPGLIFPPGMALPPMGAIPAPVPVPIPGPPPQKLPVIVMPFYSPDPAHKKKDERREKPRKIHSAESESCSDYDTPDSSGDSSSEFWRPRRPAWRRKHKRIYRRSGGFSRNTHKNKDLLTPMIQYVTKDGYVIYEKEISKGEAKDWLSKKEERETEKGVSFKELDEIKHQLGEDNVIVNHEEPKFVRVTEKSSEKSKHVEMSSIVPTPIPKVRRKQFKRVDDGVFKLNKIHKLSEKDTNIS